MDNGSDDPRFWEELYRAGDSPWDLGEPAPSFVRFATGEEAPQPGDLIVLGCGRGHDAVFFAGLGYEVTAVDFAPSALEDARRLAERSGVQVDFVQADMFALPQEFSGRFDSVVEHTCFAAIPPQRRPGYVEVVHGLLRPGGLYIAVLFAHGRTGGPPFTTDIDEVRTMFGPRFRIERLEVAQESVKARQGKELFALMRRV
jgi:methyl halide transferase